ncbi:MAG: hypothetical protein HY741_17150 [Chloroflexi bacterium]|nr:hypothetical protein [Chloroflexota bacterium]
MKVSAFMRHLFTLLLLWLVGVGCVVSSPTAKVLATPQQTLAPPTRPSVSPIPTRAWELDVSKTILKPNEEVTFTGIINQKTVEMMEQPFYVIYVWDNNSPTRKEWLALSAGAELSRFSEASQVMEFVSVESERDQITLTLKGRKPGTAEIMIGVGAVFHREWKGIRDSYQGGFQSVPVKLMVIQ